MVFKLASLVNQSKYTDIKPGHSRLLHSLETELS
jgi:hypothetical protein